MKSISLGMHRTTSARVLFSNITFTTVISISINLTVRIASESEKLKDITQQTGAAACRVTPVKTNTSSLLPVHMIFISHFVSNSTMPRFGLIEYDSRWCGVVHSRLYYV